MENLINKKKRKDSEVTFNHNEDNINYAIIGVENIVEKTNATMNKLVKTKYSKKTEIIEHLYNIDKIELALITACVLAEYSDKK